MPTYPVLPGVRFSLDVDGTLATTKFATDAAAVDVTTGLAGVMAMNGANPITRNGSGTGNWDLNLVFPELRDITGSRWSGWSSRGFDFGLSAFWSPDTTDGLNGTWTQIGPPSGSIQTPGDSLVSYRSALASVAVTGAKGMRFRISNNLGTNNLTFRDIHVYGFRAITGDHLAFWHPTENLPLPASALDFGDVVRGVLQPSRPFRLKNTSAALTASGLAITYADYTGLEFGSTTGQLSTDNVTFTPTINPANLAPGAISPLLHFRVNSLDTLGPSLRAGRLRATATSWA